MTMTARCSRLHRKKEGVGGSAAAAAGAAVVAGSSSAVGRVLHVLVVFSVFLAVRMRPEGSTRTGNLVVWGFPITSATATRKGHTPATLLLPTPRRTERNRNTVVVVAATATAAGRTVMKEATTTKSSTTNLTTITPTPVHTDGLRVLVRRGGLASLLLLTVWLFVGIGDARVLAITTEEAVSTITRPSSTSSLGQQYWSILTPTIRSDEVMIDDARRRSAEIEAENETKRKANTALIEYAVGTINTQYYDPSGGWNFTPKDFYQQWKHILQQQTEPQRATTSSSSSSGSNNSNQQPPDLTTRQGAVTVLRDLVATLQDPYSKYLTREELREELHGSTSGGGFLGIGAYVAVPKPGAESIAATTTAATTPSSLGRRWFTTAQVAPLPIVTAVGPNSAAERAGIIVGDKIMGIGNGNNSGNGKGTGIANFVGWSHTDIAQYLSSSRTPNNSNNHKDFAEFTVAKPVYSYRTTTANPMEDTQDKDEDGASSSSLSSFTPNDSNRDIVIGYRSTKVKIPITNGKTNRNNNNHKATIEASSSAANTPTFRDGGRRTSSLRGDAAVQYEFLTTSSWSSSPFGAPSSSVATESANDTGSKSRTSTTNTPTSNNNSNNKVGYIRLTRFSKLSTQGFLDALQILEQDDAPTAYIIDLRNNYGGVIQEAMLLAASVLGDPHAVLCYLLNARGGFTPVDVEQYVVDGRYPGYLLSHEDPQTVLEQIQQEHPSLFRTVRVPTRRTTASSSSLSSPPSSPAFSTVGSRRAAEEVVSTTTIRIPQFQTQYVANDPFFFEPSSYASIHEQVVKHGIHRIYNSDGSSSSTSTSSNNRNRNKNTNTKILNHVLLQQQQRERKLYQKDIVLLINEGTASSAEFFAAALQDNDRCVAVIGTKSFGKGLIQHTFPMPDGGGLKLTIGEFLRPSLRHVTNTVFHIPDLGGVRPDVYCDNKQGIPGKPSADLCVGVALDVLEEHRTAAITTVSTTTATTKIVSAVQYND